MKEYGDPVIETYSRLAGVYDDSRNIASCWERITQHSFGLVMPGPTHNTIVDLGCGTGRELIQLASSQPLEGHRPS